MKKIVSRLLYVLLLAGGLTQAFAQQQEDEKVLFIGNSFTYFWNMPDLVEAMAKDQGVNLYTDHSTVGGSNLKQHWEEEKETQTRKRLEAISYDRAVLQDHSLSTIDHTERFQEYGERFIELLRNKGTEPLLYMSWAYDSNPLMQDKITQEYLALGKKHNLQVVPAGLVIEKARQLRPDLDLFFDDKHPSADGAYLIALVFYKALTGKSISEIPNRLYSEGDFGERHYLCFVLPETGDFFRDLVEQFDVEPYDYSK
ncbi:hypothetical protein [Robertkochia aurantiaca]|uniref:hypothetical protein n=1 Tax=Robertkochia aurantiaca TaxID=2873700 RepID=UPI001CCDCF7C|nr:hypothetical protein [Robertkochia sp. 3YJGBD-33]